MPQFKASYPSIEHERAAQTIVEFFSEQDIDAVLLTCSCARGKASIDSCLDISILKSPDKSEQMFHVKRLWNQFHEYQPVFKELDRRGKYSHVDMDFIDGQFEPQDWAGLAARIILS